MKTERRVMGKGPWKRMDHRDPHVLHAIFQRYVDVSLVFRHQQSHTLSQVYAGLARQHLHTDDPLGRIVDACVASGPFMEHLVFDSLFVGDERTQRAQAKQVQLLVGDSAAARIEQEKTALDIVSILDTYKKVRLQCETMDQRF